MHVTVTGRNETNKPLLEFGKRIWEEIQSDIKDAEKKRTIEQRNKYINTQSSDNTKYVPPPQKFDN